MPETQVSLSLENLRRLDFGKVHAAFDKELERVVRDCQDGFPAPSARQGEGGRA
jgi:hypothetical protein